MQMLSLALLLFLQQACSGMITQARRNAAPADASGPLPALNVNTIGMTASSGQTFQFSASGSTGPYVYSVASGSGSINASMGLFTVGNIAQPTVVRVTSATGF